MQRQLLNIVLTTLTCTLNWSFGEAFNIDTSNVQIYHGPKDSMFGFSVAQHRERSSTRSWLLIGAPRANTTQPGVLEGGAVFRCEAGIQNNCEIVNFDKTGNNKVVKDNIDFKSRQFFGATVKSSSDDSSILACAPLYSWRTTNKEYHSARSNTDGRKRPDQLVGTCFTSDESLRDFGEYSPCRADKIQSRPQSGFCQVGFGADLTRDADGMKTFIGAVGNTFYHGEIFALEKTPHSSNSDGVGEYRFRPPGDAGIDKTSKTMPDIKFSKSYSRVDEDGYLGYSVSAGEFTGDNKSDVVVGMPRGANLLGKVTVFSSELESLRTFNGRQIGAYFGYSLCVLDLNGDGFQDIVVGAPMFSNFNKEGAIGDEIGRVYIFYQSETGKFPKNRKDTVDGSTGLGRFGLSLCSVGDLNDDDFEDLAVGAPFAGPNGFGAVYIFNGAKNGVRRKYSQVIYGYDSNIKLKAFGFSLSGGKDLDGNGFPELVVGAYESDAVVYFRSNPVVRVNASVSYPAGHSVNLDDKNCSLESGVEVSCFPVRLCMFTSHGQLINFKVHLRLDSTKAVSPRMFFLSSEGSNVLTRSMSLKRGINTCINAQAYLKKIMTDKTTPFDLDLQYSIINDHGGTAYVLDQGASTLLKDKFMIKRNCGSGADIVCVPDLSITIAHSHESIILGSKPKIWFEITVYNYGEESYGSALYAKVPQEVTYQNMELISNKTGLTVLCSPPTTSASDEIKCDIGDPFPSFTNFTVKLYFQTQLIPMSAFSRQMSHNFEFRVQSSDGENVLGNNAWNISIPLQVKTELQAFGVSRPPTVLYNASFYESQPASGSKMNAGEHNIGPEIAHSYILKCGGPSSIAEAEVTILWPSLLNEKHFLYLLDQPIIEGPGKCDFIPGVNPLNFSMVFSISRFDELRQISLEHEQKQTANNYQNQFYKNGDIQDLDLNTSNDSRSEQKIVNVLNVQADSQAVTEPCGKTDLGHLHLRSRCTRIRCKVGPLTTNSETNVVIHLRGRIYSEALKQLSSNGLHELKFKSTLNGKILTLPYGVSAASQQNVNAKIETYISKIEPGQSELQISLIPWWAFAIIIVGASVVLLVLIIILQKSGFFTRFRRPTTVSVAEALDPTHLHSENSKWTYKNLDVNLEPDDLN